MDWRCSNDWKRGREEVREERQGRGEERWGGREGGGKGGVVVTVCENRRKNRRGVGVVGGDLAVKEVG